jgi:hypothetical protein
MAGRQRLSDVSTFCGAATGSPLTLMKMPSVLTTSTDFEFVFQYASSRSGTENSPPADHFDRFRVRIPVRELEVRNGKLATRIENQRDPFYTTRDICVLNLRHVTIGRYALEFERRCQGRKKDCGKAIQFGPIGQDYCVSGFEIVQLTVDLQIELQAASCDR